MKDSLTTAELGVLDDVSQLAREINELLTKLVTGTWAANTAGDRVGAIEELREQGFTVRVHHWRRVLGRDLWYRSYAIRREGAPFDPRGGLTEVVISRDGAQIARGEARCSPRDNYCRRLGRTIALGRALEQLDARRFPS